MPSHYSKNLPKARSQKSSSKVKKAAKTKGGVVSAALRKAGRAMKDKKR